MEKNLEVRPELFVEATNMCVDFVRMIGRKANEGDEYAMTLMTVMMGIAKGMVQRVEESGGEIPNLEALGLCSWDDVDQTSH